MKQGLSSAAVFAALTCAITASPAGAAPPDAADRYGVAPGGDAFAVVAGRPHVAYATRGGIRVAKLAGFNGAWVRVGGLLRHTRNARANQPDLVGGPDGHPWLTWIETVPGREFDSQVRVATFAHGRWHEIGRGARPVNGAVFHSGVRENNPFAAAHPSIAFYRRLPVVGFAAYNGIGFTPAAAQMREGGRSWRALPRPPLRDISRFEIAVAGGRLYAGGTGGFTINFADPEVVRLNAAGTGWEDLGNIDPKPPRDAGRNGFVDALANVDGRIGVLWRHRENGVNTPNVSTLGSGNAWSEIDPPLAASGPNVTGLDVSADHSVAYAAYLTGSSATPGVQVRRLIRGEWETLNSPTASGYRGISAQFAPARGRGMWLLSGERAGGHTRYVLDGYSVVAPPQLPTPPPPPRAKVVHWWDSGATVRLVAGQSLVVVADRSNSGSTGYHWERARRANGGILRFVSSRRISGGQRIVYRARGAGGTALVLRYVPPGRGGRALETFRLNVRVG